ncbi:MAG TPA: hypothetical protein VIM79_21815, partial [Niastella sp.]
MNTLLTWYYSGLVNKDSQQVISALTSAEKQFTEKGKQLLQRQAWLLQQNYKAERSGNVANGAIMMLAAADAAGQKNWAVTQA